MANTTRTLTVSSTMFTDMLASLIASGVSFEAEELNDCEIRIRFLGGY